MSEKDHTDVGMESINTDELVGFILRRAYEQGVYLDYEQARSVLEGETEFMKVKGLIKDETGRNEVPDKRESKESYFG